MSVGLGPILQFRGIANNRCMVSAMVVCDLSDEQPRGTLLEGAPMGCPIKIAEIPFSCPKNAVWRFDIEVELGLERIAYQIAGVEGAFVVPNVDESPRMAYGSCNGFSDPKLRKQVEAILQLSTNWFPPESCIPHRRPLFAT